MTTCREAWRFRVNGKFPGSFMRTVGDVLVLAFQDEEHWTRLAGVSADGVGLWEKRWDDFEYFFCSRDRLFTDGDKARRICPSSGEVLAERGFGESVYIERALDAGPIYRIIESQRYFGLDGETLDLLWEFEPDIEDFTFDEGRLCRYRAGEGISIFELPSLTRHGPIPAPPEPASGAHGHCGDLFCQFAYSEGGRVAVDLKTGKVAWRHAEPSANGIAQFASERAYTPRHGVSAYDLRTGELAWKRTFGDHPSSPLKLHGGKIYLATGDRFVHVLDAESGEVLLSHQLQFKITGTVEPSPVIPFGDNRIVVGTRKEIICLDVHW